MSARKLVVTWPNPTHQLLSTFSLVIREGANQLSPVTSFAGDTTHQARFEFDVQSLTSRVGLNLTFTSSIGGGSAQVLNANLILAPNGADLSPESHQIDPTGPNKRQVSGSHPLILTGSDPANGALAVTVIQVNTQFVNVTDIWNKTAAGEFLNGYNALHDPNVSMVVLGHTGGSPLIWFASIPKACVESTTVSPIVFFRPTLPYQYTTLDNPDHKGTGMASVCRYVLAPDLPGASRVMKGTHIIDLGFDRFTEDAQKRVNFMYVCASFDLALKRSSKPIILLSPLPQSGTDFGEAMTSQLYMGKVVAWPDVGTPLVDSAILLLRAEDKILRPAGTFKVGRRGLMGYSAGGRGFWSAFSANKKKLAELYSLDTEHTQGKAPQVAQWAAATPGFKLRLVGVFQFHEHNNIKATVNSAVLANKGSGEVSTHPATEKFWLPTAPDGSKWWEHAMSNTATFRKVNDDVAQGKETRAAFVRGVKSIRHQFALFGGEVFDPLIDSARLAHPGPNTQTWFENFLRNSNF